MLPLIAQAMDLPLYTGLIKGKAVERGPEYGDRSNGGEGSGTIGDETEDLTALLKRVLVCLLRARRRPELNIRSPILTQPLSPLGRSCQTTNGYVSSMFADGLAWSL